MAFRQGRKHLHLGLRITIVSNVNNSKQYTLPVRQDLQSCVMNMTSAKQTRGRGFFGNTGFG